MHTKLLLTASIALALAGNCFAAVKDGSRVWQNLVNKKLSTL